MSQSNLPQYSGIFVRPIEDLPYGLAGPKEKYIELVSHLKAHGVHLIGDLVQLRESEVSKIPKVGRRGLKRIETLLASHGGLELGMKWELTFAKKF